MLEKPELPDATISAHLQNHYGVQVVQVDFLPLGADPNTAVYRVTTDVETAYFLKLRSGVFDETSVAVPSFLREQGIAQIIAPIATRTRRLWAALGVFTAILYPFVEGHNGFEVNLPDNHWITFGAALKRIHTAIAPQALTGLLAQEAYSPQWRDIVKTFLERVETETFDDPVAAKLAAFLKDKRGEISDLVARSHQLGLALQVRPSNFVLCHSDIHAGNILLSANEYLYIVDWDNPILAPKERDLMFIGGGVGGVWNRPREEALFYQGYGQPAIDPIAVPYYRYERIVQDIAVTCQQLLLTNEGGEDREVELKQVTNQFLPNNVVEIAYQSDPTIQ